MAKPVTTETRGGPPKGEMLRASAQRPSWSSGLELRTLQMPTVAGLSPVGSQAGVQSSLGTDDAREPQSLTRTRWVGWRPHQAGFCADEPILKHLVFDKREIWIRATSGSLREPAPSSGAGHAGARCSLGLLVRRGRWVQGEDQARRLEHPSFQQGRNTGGLPGRVSLPWAGNDTRHLCARFMGPLSPF